jgi:hypothetical protein
VDQNTNKKWNRYQMLTTHWAHADQQRQTLLYNFLTAGSVLIIAWVTVFNFPSTIRAFFLSAAISIIGIVASLLWWRIGIRSNGYIDMYERVGREIERDMENPNTWPFHHREQYRGTVIRFLGREIRAGTINIVIPILFLAFFSISILIAWVRLISDP